MKFFGNAADKLIKDQLAELERKFQAISRSQAVIEFRLDGTIVEANENFCKAMGYSASEIVGRKHSMFVDPQYAASEEYAAFWRALNRGEFSAQKFRRLAKGGREPINRLDFDNHAIFDDDIRTKRFIINRAGEVNRHGHLTLNGKAFAG